MKQLTGFARVPLAAGEAKDVNFRVHADRTSFTGRDLRRIVEPGAIEILIGTSAEDLPLHATVTLTGAIRETGRDRVLLTPVEVRKA